MSYASAAGLHCQGISRRTSVCFGEFAQCKHSAAPGLSRSTSRLQESGLQSSFVSRTSHLLASSSNESSNRRAKRGAVLPPRAMVATATEVAEVGHLGCFVMLFRASVKASCFVKPYVMLGLTLC